jgi:hypothetical protein
LDWSSITPAVVIALCSLVTAFCSFFVALSNYRRSNYSVVRVVETSTSGGMALDRGEYIEFKIVVQNLGIPLHNVGMSLQYSPEDGFGWGTFPMKTADGKPIREGQFAKGAITEFTFATDRLDHGYDGFIRTLTDLKSQRARLALHADRYAMWSYRLHDRLWWLKRRWNRFAHRLTWGLTREVTTPRGTRGIKHIVRIPAFESPGQKLLQFASMVRNTPPHIKRSGERPFPGANAIP